MANTSAAEPKTWSKDEEIALLDKVIKQLGTRSYLGPWLAENRNSIAADIRNDVVIELETPYKAYRRGLEIVADARKEATAIIEAARVQAARELEVAKSRVQAEYSAGRRWLEAAAGRL